MSKYIIKAKKTSLKAPLTASATSVILKSLKDIKDNNILLASSGDWLVIVVKQGDNIEMIKVNAIAYASDGTATLTVATNGRYLDPTTPYAGSSTGLTFQSGAEVIITNDPLTVTQFANLNLAHTWSELQTFEEIPILPDADPTDDNEAVRKSYADQKASKAGNNTFSGNNTFNNKIIASGGLQSATTIQAIDPVNADDVATKGWALAQVFGGSLITGLNSFEINYLSDGKVKSVHEVETGITFVLVYNSDDTLVGIETGDNFWAIKRSADSILSVQKH